MDNKPFIFGIPVEGCHFIGREAEAERSPSDFKYGINTMLLSPRHWGKTSLVNKVAAMVNSKDIIVVTMDIFSCRNEYHTTEEHTGHQRVDRTNNKRLCRRRSCFEALAEMGFVRNHSACDGRCCRMRPSVENK